MKLTIHLYLVLELYVSMVCTGTTYHYFNLPDLLAVTQILHFMHFLSLSCLLFILTLFKTIFYAVLCSCNVVFLNV